MQFDELYREVLKLDIENLKEIKDVVEIRLNDLHHAEVRNRKLSREEIIKTFHHFGYIVPDDAKFWKVMLLGDGYGGYGMEVGRYEHSCHIDSSELIVLLVVNGDKHFTESYADLWLEGPF